MECFSGTQDVLVLCRKAFDEVSDSTEASQAALKAVANTLLLHETTRQEFAKSTYPLKVADRLQVSIATSTVPKQMAGNTILGARRRPF